MSEWVPGADGILERHAARIVALDGNDRVLLMRGHDSAQPERSWWFTIGGGIYATEDPKAGAVREFFEETGLAIDPERLCGPVVRRTGVFHFLAHDRRQYELFYLVTLDPAEVEATQTWVQEGLTELEKDVLDEMTWLSLAELDEAAASIEVFPRDLPALVRSWCGGWDGEIVEIFED